MPKRHRQPNILLIMADQLSAFATSPYGNAEVITPHLQDLADKGVLFTRCYCNSPLCTPSRVSMMTGQHCWNNGVWDNDTELPATRPTFVHHLRLAGYRTLASGKLHYVGPDQLHGLEKRLTTDIYDSDYSTLKSWEAAGDPPRRMPLPDDPESQARFAGNMYGMAMHIKSSGPVQWTQQLQYDEETHYQALRQLRSFAQQSEESENNPWFFIVSYTHPHNPYQITRKYWDLYEGIDIKPPARPPSGYEPHRSDSWTNTYHGIDAVGVTPEDVYRSRRGYYAMSSYIDSKVGELLEELESLGLRDDTLIIFTSDHGDMVGEHGMFFKRTVREWSSRVPLIFNAPGRIPNGKQIGEIVSLVDLYPSLLSLLGLDVPESIHRRLDGNDFTRLFSGDAVRWPNEAIIENYGEGTISSVRSVVNGNFKYIHAEGLTPQLYDLQQDPEEWTNLAGDPQYADVQEELRCRVLRGWDGAEANRRVLESQSIRMFVKRSLETGLRFPWDYQPIEDASKVYTRSWRKGGPEAVKTVTTGYDRELREKR